MNLLRNTHLLFFVTAVCGILNAQTTWRSSLYPTTWTPKGNFYTDKIIQDFSFAGYHRGEKAIPTISTNIKDVTASPYFADKTGATDATAKIQQAINDVSATGGVVYLPAGTYKVSPGSNSYCLQITKSNVVLRGAGKDKTFLVNSSYLMQNKAIIRASGNSGWYNTTTNKTLIRNDLTGPTKDIPVQSAAAYKVGDMVIVRNYVGDAWIEEHKMSTYWKGYGANLKGLAFCREITKVDYTNNIITIDAPIRYSLLTRDGSAVCSITGMISEVGLEALSIGNVQNPSSTGYGEEDYTDPTKASYNSHASYAVIFSGVVNCWIDNVNSFKPAGNTSTAHLLSNGLLLNSCKNSTIQNCHFQRPQYGGGGGNGYMYRVTGSENLVKSCISEFMRHGFVFGSMHSSGNVIHKCSDIKTSSATGATGYYKTSGNGSDHHMHFSTSNLIDQCTTLDSYFAAGFRNFGGTPIHGLTSAHSVYWNLTGNKSATGTYTQVVHTQQGRYGYAIGTSGNASLVKTGEMSLPGSATITAPVDHVEGEGSGATLVPQSLYLDQLSKRLGTATDPCASNVAPVVTLSSSLLSAVAPASITLTASASDVNGTISKVDFYSGTTLLGSDATAPYSWSISAQAAGTYSYSAKAVDNCAAISTSNVVAVSVTNATNALPTVVLTSPATGSSFVSPAAISIAATASDADGSISKVEFYQGTTLLFSDATSPYAYSWTPSSAGSYSITAKAYDNAGGTKVSAAVTVTVTSPVNSAPSVSLTSPVAGFTADAPASISLAASASDVDGTISKVEFYNGTTLLTIDLTAPYAYSWSGVAAGTYSITAKAYDNNGATKTSAAVSITINTPSTTTIGINGSSCVSAGSSTSYTVVTDAKATSASWWSNADATITVDPTNYKKATVKLNSASGSFTISCGVNYSSSPYYKEYTKTVKIGGCATRQLEVSISPYPAEESSTITSDSKILEIRLLNANGQVLSTSPYSGENEVQFQSELPSGMYIMQVVTADGTLNQPYLKVK